MIVSIFHSGEEVGRKEREKGRKKEKEKERKKERKKEVGDSSNHLAKVWSTAIKGGEC